MIFFKSITVLIFLAIISQAVKAEKMNYENHSLVIKKLETALSLMNKKDASLHPTTRRLGDLYSERARIAEFQENEKNCNGCMKSKSDRLKAIKYYNQVIELGFENGSLITQLAHLYNLTGQDHKSIGLYRRIIKKGTPTYSSLLVGESNLALAYIDYKKNKYKSALKHFEKAKSQQTKQPRSVTNYYIAWCKFNLGQEKIARNLMETSLKSAIKESHKNPEMADFANQASRDLTIFYARTQLTTSRINKLLDLTPQAVQISNFKALAEEVERLGKHKSTAKIWGLITKVTKNPTAKIEAQFRYANSSYNIGHLKTAQSQYGQAVKTWKSNGCKTNSDFDCKELKVLFRNFVINWNNTEKSKPSSQLMKAYNSYLSLFSDDVEMLRWAAQASIYRDDFKSARTYYRNINDNKISEKSLLAEIEMAEKSNSNSLKMNSYNYYLSNNKGGKHFSQIRYQKAQTHYDLKQYQQAGTIFCDLANSSKTKLGLKSAHLCLDTYAVSKDSKNVENKALLYSKLYKKNKTEFLKIARNAGLNLVASNLKGKSSNSELRTNLKKLENINLVGASQNERINVYKNIIAVSDQLNDIPKALQATKLLYRMKGLSQKDNNFCLNKLVYYNETLLNFNTALKRFKKLHPVKKASRSQLIRMSVLAELAGLNPNVYDKKILSKTKGIYASNKIRAKIILNSKYSWREFKKYEKKLKKSKKLYSALVLELYAKTKSSKYRRQVLTNKFLVHKSAGQRLHRTLNLNNLNRIKNKIKKHKIITHNDRTLAKTLKKRLDLIESLESNYVDSAKDKDWLTQVVALQILSIEYTRLYNNILTFKSPKGLNANEVAQYKKLLKQQATPYLTKAKTAQNKSKVFWNNPKLFSNLVNDHNSAKRSVQKLISNEIKVLSQYAPQANRSQLSKASIQAQPSRQKIATVYNSIKKSPFNTSALNAGIQLEKQLERDTRATYFAERLKLSSKRNVN